MSRLSEILEQLMANTQTVTAKHNAVGWDEFEAVKDLRQLRDNSEQAINAYIAEVIGNYSDYPSHYTISDVLAEQRKRAGLEGAE